jgi:hypothetical protein
VNEWVWSFDGMLLTRQSEVLRAETVPVQVSPPLVPHGLASDYLSHGIAFGGCDWICVDQDENQWQAVVNTQILYKMAIVLIVDIPSVSP